MNKWEENKTLLTYNNGTVLKDNEVWVIYLNSNKFIQDSYKYGNDKVIFILFILTLTW